jgi:NAD(P)-dependent dehydrogenase (short-subunit alcohol dehydrogenase family)
MSAFDFDGSVAVVTGGAGGIGRALAGALSARGSRLALIDLEQGAAETAASELPGAIGLAADVGDRAAVSAMVSEVESRLGPIEIYCSNAGIATGRGLADEAAWEASWRVHGMSHVHAAWAVLPGMVERGHGAFVITASAAGLLMMMQSAPYTATKHASVAIAEWLAVNYGGQGVQFHCLCPQGVRTPMLADNARGEKELEASGGILEPAQVAEAVVGAIESGTFLVLPHPEVHGYEQAKVDDRDRWIAGMRRLLARVAAPGPR